MTSQDVEIFYNQAMNLLGQGEAQKSLEFFEKALNIDNQYTPAWNNKGIAFLELQQYRPALECFDQVIALDNNDNMVWYNKGYVFLILEEYEEAVNTLETFLVRYSPKGEFYKYAQFLLARAYYGLKEYQKSFMLLQDILKKDKNFAEAKELLNLVLKDIKEED